MTDEQHRDIIACAKEVAALAQAHEFAPGASWAEGLSHTLDEQVANLAYVASKEYAAEIADGVDTDGFPLDPDKRYEQERIARGLPEGASLDQPVTERTEA